ncbi:MAG: N-acetylmuramoyl-L-alanine amidase [Burkholderiaceae bacterium]
MTLHLLARRPFWWPLLLTLLLAACAAPGPGGLSLNRSHPAQGQDSRVDFLVIHYTASGNEASLATLTKHNVSSHYLITREPRPQVYLLVNEERRAWHAGLSEWRGRTYLNNASIGIELVNQGPVGDSWQPYTPEQIDVLVRLAKDIAKRHNIDPRNVVGHSDIAPQRKQDPGPLFPWKLLAEHGVGRWYDETAAASYTTHYELNGLPGASEVQANLQRLGYSTPQTGVFDPATRNVITAFQMRYRPARHDGLADAQTLGILKALQ